MSEGRAFGQKPSVSNPSATQPSDHDVIDGEAMRARQWLIVGICVALNALDGFDVMSVSLAAPGIKSDWSTGSVALGFILSMELFGMALGSILLGGFADSRGRRPTILLCLTIMAAGMYGAAAANGLTALSICRLITGLGIGGMLASVSAVAAEFSNQRWRNTSVSLVAAGFPLGMVIGGAISAGLLEGGSWRDVFLAGAIATSLALPLVYLLVPETLAFLLQQRKPNTLDKANRTLRAIGCGVVSNWPALPSTAASHQGGWLALFSKPILPITAVFTLTFFLHMISSYFVVKWIPVIVTNQGFSPAQGASVLVWASLGGLLGALSLSLLTARGKLNALALASLLLAGLATAAFGLVPRELSGLSLAAGAAVFFANAAVVGLYALMAASFPTRLRASGIGFVIGIGRGGAAIGPILGGLLFSIKWPLEMVMLAMAAGSLLATAILALLLRSSDKATLEVPQ